MPKMPKRKHIEAKITQTIRETKAQYEQRSVNEATRKLYQVEHAPLQDRREAKETFFEAMRDTPEIVAQRVAWIFHGNYGMGEMILAQRVLSHPRMNRTAALTHLVGAIEWGCPQTMAIAAWKKLTRPQQAALNHAVQNEIDDRSGT